MGERSRLIIGAMSGTSADGVDVVLTRITGSGMEMTAESVLSGYRPYPGGLRQAIVELRAGTAAPLSILAQVAREIALCYAAAVNELLVSSGKHADDIAAVAAHGQTLYHNPPETIQWMDPAVLAAEVGCPVVSDFRRADCAAGGQGAPLVPLADYLLFRSPDKNRVLLNLGGIANVTYLRAGGKPSEVIAFDTGPGNCISDHLMRLLEPKGVGWDEGGRLAGMGMAVYPIAQRVLAAEYFFKSPPKSTDGPAMIKLFALAQSEIGRKYPVENLLRTACLISADTILQAMRQFLEPFPDEVIVSGGGTRNRTLMQLLRQPLGEDVVKTSEELGMESSGKEALAFAILAAHTLDGLPGNLPSATGARRAVVLGSITPKP